MEITRQSSIPLYQQIAEDLMQKIENKDYRQNEKLPTEKELSEHYSVSRLTIRRALQILTDSAYITVKQGKGMFVRNEAISMNLDMMKGINEILLGHGLDVKTSLVKIEEILATEQMALELDCPLGSKVKSFQRLISLSDRPIAVLDTYLSPGSEFTKESDDNLSDSQFLNIAFSHFKRVANEMKYSFLAKPAPLEISKMLNIALGFPVLTISRTTYDNSNVPFETSMIYLCSDLYQFKFSVKKGERNFNDFIDRL